VGCFERAICNGVCRLVGVWSQGPGCGCGRGLRLAIWRAELNPKPLKSVLSSAPSSSIKALYLDSLLAAMVAAVVLLHAGLGNR